MLRPSFHRPENNFTTPPLVTALVILLLTTIVIHVCIAIPFSTSPSPILHRHYHSSPHPPTLASSTAASHVAHSHRLTRELEKKLSDRYVVFVAQRRMLRKPSRKTAVGQKRPRSRTLTAVHEQLLEDLVFPSEIVGKRTRIGTDGSKLIRA